MFGLHVKCPLFLSDFNGTNYLGQIFEKNFSDIKCHKIPSSGSPVVPCGRTDRQTGMSKLRVAFLNFANVPKNI